MAILKIAVQSRNGIGPLIKTKVGVVGLALAPKAALLFDHRKYSLVRRNPVFYAYYFLCNDIGDDLSVISQLLKVVSCLNTNTFLYCYLV